MKRVVFFLMVLFAFSCDVAPQIEISPEKYVVEAEGGIVYFGRVFFLDCPNYGVQFN